MTTLTIINGRVDRVMVFMNARKQNKTIIMLVVGFVSIGLLLSVSLYFMPSGYSTPNAGTQVTGGSAEDTAVQNFQQGMSLIQQGKNADAQKKLALAKTQFEEVIKKDAKNVQSLGDLATVYYYLGDPDKAIETVKKALEVNANFTTARLNYGVYLAYGKNNTKDAIAELKKVPKGDFNYDKAQQMITEINQINIPKNTLPAPAGNNVPAGQDTAIPGDANQNNSSTSQGEKGAQ